MGHLSTRKSHQVGHLYCCCCWCPCGHWNWIYIQCIYIHRTRHRNWCISSLSLYFCAVDCHYFTCFWFFSLFSFLYFTLQFSFIHTSRLVPLINFMLASSPQTSQWFFSSSLITRHIWLYFFLLLYGDVNFTFIPPFLCHTRLEFVSSSVVASTIHQRHKVPVLTNWQAT